MSVGARIWHAARTLWGSTHWAMRSLRMLLLGVVLFCGVLMFMEESFIFFPTPYPEGPYDGRDAALPGAGGRGVRVSDCWLQTPDGVNLHAWYAEPVRADAAGELQPEPVAATLLWSHGNAGNVSFRLPKLLALARLPARVLIYDYRGYGRSGGRPDESGVYTDAEAAWDYLVQERSTPPEQIVLLGVSLGGAVAAELATRRQPAGLVLESTFTSVPDMAAVTMPFVPQMLIRTRMHTLEKIPELKLPKLIIHGREDEIIPFEHGQKLHAAAPEPKRFVAVQGAGHNDLFDVAGGTYITELRRFLEQDCQLTAPEETP